MTIVSGGQTGVDRAALDVARECKIPCGGWCPLGRWAEDGAIPSLYPLRETATGDVKVRTELNVIDSDGTVVLTSGMPADGTGLTTQCAVHHRKPYLEIDLDKPPRPESVRDWIASHQIRTLNIAGPRESHRPGFVYTAALAFLRRVFAAT